MQPKGAQGNPVQGDQRDRERDRESAQSFTASLVWVSFSLWVLVGDSTKARASKAL